MKPCGHQGAIQALGLLCMLSSWFNLKQGFPLKTKLGAERGATLSKVAGVTKQNHENRKEQERSWICGIILAYI